VLARRRVERAVELRDGHGEFSQAMHAELSPQVCQVKIYRPNFDAEPNGDHFARLVMEQPRGDLPLPWRQVWSVCVHWWFALPSRVAG